MRLIAVFFLILAASAAADDRDLATEYIRARCATLVAGSTTADVERVIGLLREDATVEHPGFGAIVKGKAAIRSGLLSHLEEYTGDTDESGIVVLDIVEAPGAVAFKTKTTFVTGQGSERRVIEREGMTIVELRDGWIARLIEY